MNKDAMLRPDRTFGVLARDLEASANLLDATGLLLHAEACRDGAKVARVLEAASKPSWLQRKFRKLIGCES